jgi:dephospho-CoA kinase|tara:strand:+ start:143 stop:754 length:612 start_codon:yes stop_codon:yes gene_type:complete
MTTSNLKVALTGGIASGKSLVSNLLHNLGCTIIDLDILAREVVEPGTDGLNELVSHFGKDILTNDGFLNRTRLRDELYQNEQNRALIEKTLHPKILSKMQNAMDAQNHGVVIIVAPLLVEKALWAPFDRAIIIDCESDNQLSRLMAREGIDREKATSMLSTQVSREERLELNKHLQTDVIENNSSLAELEEKVNNLYQKLISL